MRPSGGGLRRSSQKCGRKLPPVPSSHAVLRVGKPLPGDSGERVRARGAGETRAATKTATFLMIASSAGETRVSKENERGIQIRDVWTTNVAHRGHRFGGRVRQRRQLYCRRGSRSAPRRGDLPRGEGDLSRPPFVGGRERTLIEGRKPFEVAEPLFSGAWEILREGDVSQVAVESATSGSRTEAVLFPEGWHITLSVPCDQDGSGPYMGCYWDAFWGAAKTAEAQVECKCEHVQAVPSEA